MEEQLEHLCTLRFTEEALAFLGTTKYLKSDFIDFLRIFRLLGTRRRFSREWQEEVVATVAGEAPECFKGTSNVYPAWKYGLAQDLPCHRAKNGHGDSGAPQVATSVTRSSPT